MKKNNIILYLVIALCVIVVVGFCVFLFINRDEPLTDAEKFKQEFEMYNGLVYDDLEEDVLEVSIPEDNPFVYLVGRDILDVLDNEDAYIFFGYATCPLTRAAIEALIEVAREEDISKIYYVDIYEMRDEYEVGDSIVPDKIIDGSDVYYEILDFFGDNLETYYVVDDNGMFRYDTGVTRLNSPTLAAIKDKEVVAMHEELVPSYDYTNRALTSEEYQELKEEYKDVFEALMAE